MRPANIVTAFSDILAGYATAGGAIVINEATIAITTDPLGLGWLLMSTFGLYGGGVVFNDVFDAELDAEERPERPIPSGRISKTSAAFFGIFLLLLGIFAAFQVNALSGTIAVFVALLALVYDKWAKHHTFMGPVVMGSCRGGNLLLGMSILPITLLYVWYLVLIPMAYIGAITLVSKGEVHGGTKASGMAALGFTSAVILGLAGLALLPGYEIMVAAPFLVLFMIVVFPPFINATRTPDPPVIRSAIKRGVLSLIILNSTLAAGFAGVTLGIVVLLLLPLSLLLSKLFAVT